MSFSKLELKKRIAIAGKRIPADIVIKNGQIVDVFNLEIVRGDIAISDGFIVGIGAYEGKKVIDAKNRYICPAFIDGHVHIESSMVIPSEYAKVVISHGVTTVIADPHEIANVSGIDGLHFMLEYSKEIPIDIYFMLPSSVPATSFENAGAELLSNDMEPFYSYSKVLGLGEVMDFPALRNAKDSLIDKIVVTSKYTSYIDGHLAGLQAKDIDIYCSSGIRTDHECESREDALERVTRGMYLLIREGTAAKNLKELIKVVNSHNVRRFLFCTDDKHLDDLIEEGSIDHNVRLAIQYGLEPLIAIQMATLNAAECYGLKNKGAIAPGYEADFIFLEDLESVDITMVFKAGQLMAQEGRFIGDIKEFKNKNTLKDSLTNTIHFPTIYKKSLQIPIGEQKVANVIEVIPHQLITKKVKEQVEIKKGLFLPSIEKDQLKLVVIERHKSTGNVGLGIVKGFGLKEGAIATTIAHDSHNIVATGTNDLDILKAIHLLKKMNGGLVVVKNGKTIASFPLPIAGLITDIDYRTVYQALKTLKQSLGELGFTGSFNPFLTLSFLTLPVIPSLKLTDLGLFDVEKGMHIEVNAE